MANDDEAAAARFMNMTVPEIKQIKDAILSIKQGEALERASAPKVIAEALALGYFGAETNLTLNLMVSVEDTVNKLCTYMNDDNVLVSRNSSSMSNLARLIATASASRASKRLDGVLEAVGKLGGSKSFTQKDLPAPVHLNATEPG